MGAPTPAPSTGRTLCFRCYRAGLDRRRALRDAAAIDTASEARFQQLLPFLPVDRARLERLRAHRAAERRGGQTGAARLVQRRQHALIAARHALERPAAGAGEPRRSRAAAELAFATRLAELQLPASWIPFVASR